MRIFVDSFFDGFGVAGLFVRLRPTNAPRRFFAPDRSENRSEDVRVRIHRVDTMDGPISQAEIDDIRSYVAKATQGKAILVEEDAGHLYEANQIS
jgi:hypothetical protein